MKNKITKLSLVLLLSGFAVSAQTLEENKQVIKDYDLEKLKKLENQFREEYEVNYNRAVKVAKERGIPIEGVDEQGKRFSLQGFVDGSDSQLRYYTSYNNVPTKSSIQTARVQDLHSGTDFGMNIEGQTMILGIWDGGAVYAGHEAMGVSRITQKDGSKIINAHASHVAGTMIANGTGNNNIKGMAPRASLWANDWDSDLSEMTAQARQGLLVSNHSYGTDYVKAGYDSTPGVFGKYTSSARSLDQVLFVADNYLPVIAAGNARNGEYRGATKVYFNPARGGADLMEGDAVSKNAVVVAAIEGITNYSQPSDVVMTDFSQWGPTDDFRIKPDISAKGLNVLSVGITGISSTAVMPGTSMAAPSVTGVFGLWQQYYKNLYPTKEKMRAATVKALMAISADEAGAYKNAGSTAVQVSPAGPDHRFGWGVINAKRGAEILRDSKSSINKSIVIEEVLNNGSIYEVKVITDGTTSLKAAIAWTDPAGNTVSADDSNVPVLVNDLDLRIIRPNGDEIFPWALNKDFIDPYARKRDNDVDPIEVVEYKGDVSGLAAAGTYTIRVTHKGSLTNGSQKFSLIVSGLKGDSVSTKDQQFDNLVVYPNPTSDLLNLKADLASIAGANVQVFDMNGKQVYENKDLFYNTNEAILDISFLNSGFYLLKLTNGEINQTIKVVKK